jgi:hypothetical protein
MLVERYWDWATKAFIGSEEMDKAKVCVPTMCLYGRYSLSIQAILQELLSKVVLSFTIYVQSSLGQRALETAMPLLRMGYDSSLKY